MTIKFDPSAYGTDLTNRVQLGLPRLGVGNGTWILVANTVTSYFRDLKKLFFLVGSSVACALTIAAFIRDIPTIVATIEKISLGAISLWTAQSRSAFLTHIVSYYFWPIGVNLLRGFFLTVAGALAVSLVSIPVRCYQNLSKYNAQKALAIDHVRNIQLIANEILKLIPEQNPIEYLTSALSVFESEERDKKALFNTVFERIENRSVENITKKECDNLYSAIESKICSLQPSAAYQKLAEAFTGSEASESEECSKELATPVSHDVPINAFISQTLNDSWQTRTDPKYCLKQLIDGFKKPTFDGKTRQLLTLLHQDDKTFKIGALYKELMTHQKGYETAVKEMQKIYGFTKPPLQIENLWQ